MLNSRTVRLCVCLTMLFVAAIAIADEAKRSLPKEIGGLPYKTAKKFEQEALGISLSYVGDGATLTIYLYKGGVAEIPSGVDSEVFAAQFDKAKNDIQSDAAFTNARLLGEATVVVGSRNLEMRKAVYEMAVKGTPYTSILYLAAGRNFFYKTRLTFPKNSPALDEQRLAAIEEDLGKVITSWITR